MIKHTSLGASIGVSMKSVVPRARAEVMMAGVTCSGSGAKILNSSVLLLVVHEKLQHSGRLRIVLFL